MSDIEYDHHPDSPDFKEEPRLDIQAQDDSSADVFRPDTRFRLAWISLLIVVLMAALDATSLSVALAKIARVLSGTAIESFWAGTSFLLTSTVFQPVYGSVSGLFGRKLLLYVALALFCIGAIVAAVAPKGHGMATLLVGRSLQGIGGGGIIVLSEIIPTDLVPLKVRGNYMSMVGAMWALGSVTGPLMGGGFASTNDANWRWIFWINLPFIVIGGLMITLFLKLNKVSGTTMDKLRRIDYLGIVVFVASTTSFLIPLTWGGVMYEWSSWRVLVPLLLGVAGLVFFVVWEEKFATEPFIPLIIVKSVNNAAVFLATFLHGTILWCMLYYQPLYFEAVKGYSPILSGVALFPATFTIAPASMAVGILVTKTGRYRWSIWGGFFFATLGFGLQYMLAPHTSIVAWVFFSIITGIGTGLLFPGLMFGVQAATDESVVAPAMTLFTFLRTFGQTVGVAIGGVIFQNELRQQILKHPLIAAHASEWASNSSALVEVLSHMQEGPSKVALIQSYADALQIVWATCCALAGAGLIASLFIKGYTIDRVLQSEQQFATKNKVAPEQDA
ncbi:putative MFS transporter [Aureobasidium pullulans]|uniref:MFS transporter n=1 Tax=Aureobasidium pullulans TaxID=5580 RepID=A0AB74IIV6_AURPU|nr:putative MFS transporter [Aureobasidium pullulans]